MAGQELFFILSYLGIILKNWWWLPLPFLLWKPFTFFWRWWRTMENWLPKQRKILLEIKMPKEVLKPIRAMETVLAGIHGVSYHPPDWWEKWIDGQVQLTVDFEMACMGGEPHFYIRAHQQYRDGVEAAVYAQFPEAEIKEVPDYTKQVPQDIPNKDWDFFGFDYKLLRPDPYPIKTYAEFETEREVVEEKRIDPVAGLLESMAKIKPGEYYWIQMLASPISSESGTAGAAFLEAGAALRDKMARRPEKPKPRPMIQEAAEILLTGKPAGQIEPEQRELIPPEMKLTPGEKEIITAVERKISKPLFRTSIRFVYFGKRDVWFKPNFRLAFNFFASFATQNLNSLIPLGATFTKIHKSWFLPLNLLRNRRHYLRCRRMFRLYTIRENPFFPRPGGNFVLNTEELASLFHFPTRLVAPASPLPRVEAKKGGPPPGLPM